MAIAVALLLSVLLQATPQELIEQLRAERIQDRNEAQRQLAALGQAAVPELQRAAKDPDLEISRRAAIVLRQIELQSVLKPAVIKAVPNAAELLASGTEQTYTQVFLRVYTTRKFQGSDLEPLALQALRGADAKDKRQVLSVIMAYKLMSTKPELLRLARDPSESIADFALQVLARLDLSAAKTALLEMLQHPRGDMRLRGIQGLQRLPVPEAAPQIAALLADPEPNVRLNVIFCIEALKAYDQLPKIIAAVRDKDRSVSLYASRTILNWEAMQAAPDLLPLFQDPEPHVRVAAIQILAQLRIRNAAAPIVERLKDKDTEVRAAAAFAVADLRAPVDAAMLHPMLKDPDSDTKKAGIWALTHLGEGLSDADLTALLGDEDSEVRIAAAWAAGRRKDAKLSAPLLKILADNPSMELPHAVIAAGKLGCKEALPALLTLAGGNSIAAPVAAETAAQLADASTLPALLDLIEKDGKEAPEMIAPAFRRLRPEGLVDKVVEAMKAGPFRDRRIRFLGALQDPRASEPLMKILKDEKEPPPLRGAAALALGRIGHHEAVPAILEFVAKTQAAPETIDAFQSLVLLDARAALPELRKIKTKGPLEAALIRTLEALGDTELLDAYATKLDDLDRPADQAAATWLCHAGRVEGLRWHMDERGGMTLANAFRNPEAWKKLRAVAIPVGVEGTPLEIAQRVATEAGLGFDWHRQDAVPDMTDELRYFRIPARGSAARGDEILEDLMKLLDDDYDIVLEGNTLRVLPIQRSHRIFEEWWAKSPLKKER